MGLKSDFLWIMIRINERVGWKIMDPMKCVVKINCSL